MPDQATNILFCDPMRWDCLWAAGNPVIKMRNLDRLASEGVLNRFHRSTDSPSATHRTR